MHKIEGEKIGVMLVVLLHQNGVEPFKCASCNSGFVLENHLNKHVCHQFMRENNMDFHDNIGFQQKLKNGKQIYVCS